MKTSRALTSVTLVTVVLATIAVHAAPSGWSPGSGVGTCEVLWEKLSLDQRIQAISLCAGLHSQVDFIRGAIGQKKIELLEFLSKPTPDDSAIQLKRLEIRALQDKIRDERKATEARVRALITYGQRKPIGHFDTGMMPGLGPWWAQ
jgi:hypothetical protein